VKGYAGIGGPLDAAAASALTGGLEELQPLGELSRPLAEGLALIGDRLGELGVGGDRPRPGRLHVSSLAQAGLAGRPHTFVIGLEEGGVFPALVEDPVLLDEERAALSPALATSADRAGEALLLIVSHLAGLGGRVCLSYSCRELRETRETFPSWLLLQALRLQRPGEELTYDHLDRALGEPAAALLSSPERALSEAGWWLSVLRGAGTGGRALLREAYPCLVQGEAAEAARASAVYTPYDGLVPRAGLLLDPRRSERPVSPTSLEGLAACPFRYFLERGLGVEATLEAEADPDAWLDPLTRGQLLHGLYAEILREMRRRGASDPMSYLPGLQLLGERRLEELRVLIPPPSEGVYAREAEELLRDLALFLRLEAAAPGRVTVGVEIPFGSEEPQGEPLGQTEPVEVDLEDGGRIRLRGRIDRIDRLPEGGYEVVDYKTGRPYLPGGLTATFAGGRQLQHGLYALAAGELLRPLDPRARVLCSSYYFPTTRGQGRRVERLQADPTAVKRVLRDLCELLAAGTFLHTADAGACKYCEFQRACGNDPVARAEAKLANPENRVLEAYRRLQTHA
jgi:ATP-dependent helicase/nuclease subunit B